MPPTMTNPPERFLTLKQVEDRSGLRRDSIYRLGRTGEFPRPTKVAAWASRWLESEINGWIAQRVAARDAALLRKQA